MIRLICPHLILNSFSICRPIHTNALAWATHTRRTVQQIFQQKGSGQRVSDRFEARACCAQNGKHARRRLVLVVQRGKLQMDTCQRALRGLEGGGRRAHPRQLVHHLAYMQERDDVRVGLANHKKLHVEKLGHSLHPNKRVHQHLQRQRSHESDQRAHGRGSTNYQTQPSIKYIYFEEKGITRTHGIHKKQLYVCM